MPAVEAVLSAEEVMALRELVRSVVIADHVKDYAIRLILATHSGHAEATSMVRRYVRHGASPRGLLGVVLTAKALALNHLIPSDDPDFGPEVWARCLAPHWSGALYIGTDGLKIPL